ncbi:MAG: hypothetical protein JNM07_10140 [Phycisphaerae bacterium]|nr:hypothetical protein [Phycisphaerae bacterium]
MARLARGLDGLSLSDLHKELRRRERRVVVLRRQRDRLLKKLDKLDATIAANGGGAGGGAGLGGGRKRAKNDTNLVEALQKLLTGKTLSVTDAAAAVQKAGYRTTSPSFRTIVNQALIASGKFKRISRGQYTSK